MLSREVVDQGEHIAENFAYGDKQLKAVEGSPLAMLTVSVRGMMVARTKDYVVSSSANINSVEGSHGELADMYATNIARTLGNVVNCAKNVVNPLCRDLLEEINAARDRAISTQVAKIGTIEMVEMPALWLDSMFLELIKPFVRVNGEVPNEEEIIRDINETFTTDELKDLMRTGSAGIDSKVLKFVGDAVIDYGIDKTDIRGLLSWFMMLTGIINGRLDKGDGLLEQPGYRTGILQLRERCGGLVNRVLQRHSKEYEAGAILVTRPMTYQPPVPSRKLQVHARAYKKLLAGGIVPEAILGAYIHYGLGFVESNIDDVVSSPGRFVEIYDNKRKHYITLSNVKSIAMVNRAIAHYLSTNIRTSDRDQLVKEKMQRELTEELAEYQYYGNSDLDKYIRKIVCEVYADGTDVYRLLEMVDGELATMETPDMRKAVYMGSVRLVAHWVRNQIKIC